MNYPDDMSIVLVDEKCGFFFGLAIGELFLVVNLDHVQKSAAQRHETA
jgi:hypothetical protein